MRISKKILACVLAAMMVFAMMPMSALAVDASDLQAALNEGGTVTLDSNVTGNFTVPVGVTVTLDLDGYTLSASSTGTPVITNRGTLTVKDGSIINNGFYFPGVLGEGGVAVMNYGTATVENITTNKGALVNRANTMTVNGGSYDGNPLSLATENASTTVINDGTFSLFIRCGTGSSTVVNGGTFSTLGYRDGANYTINGGKINSLAAEDSGDTLNSMTITGGKIGNIDDYTEYVAEGYKVVNGEVVKDGANNGANISVADEISQNVYIDTDFYGEESYATIEYNHASNASEAPDFQTETVQLKDLPSLDDPSSAYNGASMLSVIQAPAQSTEPITVNIYATAADAAAGTNAVDTIEYSVYNYCKKIIDEYEGEKADQLKDLAKATLDYAAAAQKYFSYNEANMATKDAAGDYYADVANVNLSSVTGITSRPSEIKSVTVVVKSDLEINLLSKTPVAVNGSSWDATSGGSRFSVNAIDEPNGDWYVINIKGIEPANMDSTITVNTSHGYVELTANSIMKIMANSGNANMATLAKAMYLYGQAANNYFDA